MRTQQYPRAACSSALEHFWGMITQPQPPLPQPETISSRPIAVCFPPSLQGPELCYLIVTAAKPAPDLHIPDYAD